MLPAVAFVVACLILGQGAPAPPTDAVRELASPQEESAALRCPVMPDQEVDPAIFLDWGGRRVYFCCRRCKSKFAENPEKFAAALAKYQPATVGGKDASRSDTTEREKAVDSNRTKDTRGEDRITVSAEDPRLLVWLGKLHPITLHLPIGALFGAALAELFFAWRKKLIFDHAVRFGIWLAGVTGVVTAILGWFLGGVRWADSDWLMALHRWLGSGTAIVLIVLVFVSERTYRRERSRRGLRMLLGFATLLLSAAGFFGGAMVWGLHHLAW